MHGHRSRNKTALYTVSSFTVHCSCDVMSGVFIQKSSRSLLNFCFNLILVLWPSVIHYHINTLKVEVTCYFLSICFSLLLEKLADVRDFDRVDCGLYE